MTTYSRADRVGDLMMREIAQMIVGGEIKDPRVVSAVITGARVTRDLGLARIFFTVLDADKTSPAEVKKGLDSASRFIRNRLWSNLRMKRVPEIRFESDTALEEGYRIDHLLRGLENE